MIEICCGSYEDAMHAYFGGAKKIELNSALHLGGLTPSLAAVKLIKKNTDLEVIAMVRPRGAGFCYQELEFAQIIEEATILLENGVDGLAFGFLNADHTLDVEKTKYLIALVKKYEKVAVFHRAYDCVKEPIQVIEELITLGVDRLLTSGLSLEAMEGKDVLKRLQQDYSKKIEILAGSGVNVGNAKELMDYTKVEQIHSSCKSWAYDPTTSGDVVDYCYASCPNENNYDVVSVELVKELVQSLDKTKDMV